MEQTATQTKPIEEVLTKRPLIISGPCSAETEEQVMQTAIRLAATGKVDVMRAGIWKPRTRPRRFEGIGTKGLPWLQQARKVTGIPVAVEVATSKQAEDALPCATLKVGLASGHFLRGSYVPAGCGQACMSCYP